MNFHRLALPACTLMAVFLVLSRVPDTVEAWAIGERSYGVDSIPTNPLSTEDPSSSHEPSYDAATSSGTGASGSLAPARDTSADDYPRIPADDRFNLVDISCHRHWIDPLLEILLGAASLYILLALVDRLLTLRLVARSLKSTALEITTAVRMRQWDAALETCRNGAKDPIARIAEPALMEMNRGAKITGLSLECVRLALTRGASNVRLELGIENRKLISIAVIAPMIGLLGSIIDFCQSVSFIYEAEGHWQYFASSLLFDLVPLVIGAVVGVGSYLVYQFVRGMLSKIEAMLTAFEADLLLSYVKSRRSLPSIPTSANPRQVSFLKTSNRRRVL